jgi:hypothetical protein
MEDGRLRSDDELVEEMRRELDFKYRGRRIEEALRRAISKAQGRNGPGLPR